jgi:hypothetical protein
MTLAAAAEDSVGWWVRTGADPADVTGCFTFPLLGAPWDHVCGALRSSTVTLDVIIAAWNSAGSLGPCLDAIALSSLNRHAPHRLRVIVCDDGSTDSTQDDLRARSRDLNLLVIRQEHRSQAFAINAALDRAEADVIVFCDADMLLGCGALDELAARHERWPDVVCAGFRGNIDAAALPEGSDALAELIHREALSGDNRVRFHLPTLAPNMMDATGWLAGLGGGRHLLDCEGTRWARHRYVFGCLFSAARDLVDAAAGMPEIVPRWGFQDSLLVARLEALGGFVLPVAAAWGWHVTHEIRHADQWFQYRRNSLAYAEILAQKPEEAFWRAPADAPAVREVWSVDSTEPVIQPERSVHATADLLHALGLWEACLDRLGPTPSTPREMLLADECRLRLGRVEELSAAPAGASLWHAVALLRIGRIAEAGTAFRRCADGADPVAHYATSASPPELLHLGAHFEANGMPEVARLHRDVATLLDPNRGEADR